MKHQVYVISDGTGKTAKGALQSAMAQFGKVNIRINIRSNIHTDVEIKSVLHEAKVNKGFVVHTIVSKSLRDRILILGRLYDVETIDLMGPLLARLAELLAATPRSEPGLFDPFDPSYLQRIEAIDFTVQHDDGQNYSQTGPFQAQKYCHPKF